LSDRRNYKLIVLKIDVLVMPPYVTTAQRHDMQHFIYEHLYNPTLPRDI